MAGGALDRWKRTWWVFLPLVSLGLLAFVPFAIAGLKARRRDWLVWSVVYAAGAWGIAFLDWLGDEPVRSIAGFLFLVAIGGFSHALWIRRPFLEGMGMVERRRRDRLRETMLSCVLVGSVVTVAAPIALAAGASPMAAGAAGALGLGSLGISALFVGPSRTALPVLREGALAFRYRAWVVRAAGAGFLSLGLSLVLLAQTGAVTGFERVVLLAGGLLSAVPAGLILRAARDPHLAVTPEGLSARTTFARTALPWEVVTGIGLFSLGLADGIGVEVSDPAAIRMPLIDRINQGVERRALPDAVYPARQLEADPRLVVETLVHYWKHPGDRWELGTPASLQRFERLRDSAGDLSAHPA